MVLSASSSHNQVLVYQGRYTPYHVQVREAVPLFGFRSELVEGGLKWLLLTSLLGLADRGDSDGGLVRGIVGH